MTAIDPAMAVGRLDLVTAAILHRAETVLKAGLDLRAHGIQPLRRGQLLFHLEAQHAGQTVGNGAGGESALTLPVLLQTPDGAFE